MIRSKFRIGAVLPLIASLFLFAVVILAIFKFPLIIGHNHFLPIMIALFFCTFSLLWLIWGELRTKVLQVSIEPHRIKINNYLGLGPSRLWNFSETDGFRISILSSEYRDYEYLYIIKDKRKIVKLSEFYHKNYFDLKKDISKKCKNLGTEKFSLIQELKEIFL